MDFCRNEGYIKKQHAGFQRAVTIPQEIYQLHKTFDQVHQASAISLLLSLGTSCQFGNNIH